MKKRLVALLLVLCCIFGATGITACDQNTGSVTNSGKKESSSVLNKDSSVDSSSESSSESVDSSSESSTESVDSSSESSTESVDSSSESSSESVDSSSDDEPPEGAYTRLDENYILFGSYPQTKVTDSSLTSALNTAAGTKPTASNSYEWESYKYYISSSNSTDYMWYQDITYGEEEYRGVYFTSYRPYYTYYTADYTNQDDNGYTTSNIYWFKYEPIKWRILKEESGYAILLCEMIIDSQEYYHSTSSRTIDGETVYANNYAESNIRKWLNDNFYETAFSELQQSIIQEVTVDNSAASTGYNPNQYECANTPDKVWLLSAQEAIAMTGSTSSSTVREKKTTDYAQCQGAYTNKGSYAGNGYWWLRSPYDYASISAWSVGYDGRVGFSDRVLITDLGVVPALQIRLS